MNIELEKVTEEEQILEKLIEQYKLDEKENASEHIEEIDPDPQLLVKPLISQKEAYSMAKSLIQLFKTETRLDID